MNQPITSNRFPDCSYPSQVLQAPRTRAVPASGQSLVASLTVPFPPRPTSPAYSPTSPACALRCRKPLFFAVCTCRRFESHVLFHTDSPTCVFPCPRALYDAMSSPEASWRTAEAAALAATAHAAFCPLDPALIAQCFYPIGRRPVARSAIDLRLALREGRPISRARLLFYPAIRVDSPTSPAVACSVRRQLPLHVERLLGRVHIAHLFCPSQYSPTVGLRVIFLQKSSFSSCLSLRSHRPIVPLVLVRLQRITKPSKIVTRLVFELFCSLFFST